MTANLKASDGYLVHGVVDRLDDVQHGGQSLLELSRPLSFTALQHFLEKTGRESERLKEAI